MALVLYPLLFAASFGALAILLLSAMTVSIWLAYNFIRAIFGLPQGLRELRTRRVVRRAIQADLNLLRRAGA
jgi:uncharacterized protein YjeT (DUF2065 family)